MAFYVAKAQKWASQGDKGESKCWLLITSRSTPKDDEYTHTLKRRRRMRNNRGNALKPLKTHIQPSKGRKECSDALTDALGVPIYSLTRRKTRKTSLGFSRTTVSLSARFGDFHVSWRARCAHLGGCYNNRRDVHTCVQGVVPKSEPLTRLNRMVVECTRLSVKIES